MRKSDIRTSLNNLTAYVYNLMLLSFMNRNINSNNKPKMILLLFNRKDCIQRAIEQQLHLYFYSMDDALYENRK